MEDLVRRYCSRRDAQGNAHTLAEDIRMISLEALLPDDLEKHVQLNRARLTSYGVLREEVKTYCECGDHANARNEKQKGSSHPGGDDPMDIGAFGKGKGKGKGKQGQQGQHGQDKDKSKDKNRNWLNVGTVESADTTRKTVGARRTPTKVVRRENTNPRMKMLTILTRNHQMLNQKSKLVDSTCFTSMLMQLKCEGLNGSRLESTQVQERQHGPRVSHTGRSFLVMVTSLSAQRLENLSKVARECMSRVATIGDPI